MGTNSLDDRSCNASLSFSLGLLFSSNQSCEDCWDSKNEELSAEETSWDGPQDELWAVDENGNRLHKGIAS